MYNNQIRPDRFTNSSPRNMYKISICESGTSIQLMPVLRISPKKSRHTACTNILIISGTVNRIKMDSIREHTTPPPSVLLGSQQLWLIRLRAKSGRLPSLMTQRIKLRSAVAIALTRVQQQLASQLADKHVRYCCPASDYYQYQLAYMQQMMEPQAGDLCLVQKSQQGAALIDRRNHVRRNAVERKYINIAEKKEDVCARE